MKGKPEVLDVLAENQGRVSDAAERLGLTTGNVSAFLTADTVLGSVDSSEKSYQSSAFVFDFVLPPALRKAGTSWVTGVCLPRQGRPNLVVLAENPTGAYVNADQYVLRMNPNGTADVPLWATACGMAGAFGFEKEHYEISVKCGERVLLPRVRQTPGSLLQA